MKIDRHLLNEVSTKKRPQLTGISSLTRGIHRHEQLRDWVSFETIALPPIPVLRLGEWSLVSLLTVPCKTENEDSYKTPWAVVEWSLSTMKVTKKVDLRSLRGSHPLWESQLISARPADVSINLDNRSRTIRENILFASLEKFCTQTNRNNPEFSKLAQHYSGLLPKELYSYYHNLIPESQEWLLADVPALQINVEVRKSDRQTTSSEETPTNPKPLEISETIPNDLTDRLPQWLNRASAIANSISEEDKELGDRLIKLLQVIDKRRTYSAFRLAFVGEFSRGKSHLINRLLNTNILPEGALATTATLTSIVSGTEEQMEVRAGGKIEVRPLAENSWEDLLATDSAGADNEVFAGVRISLDREWLRSLDVEIIDTPGAGDLNDRRANMVSDLLNQCDAAVLVVSATSPFSMTEAAFLEQEVIGRHVTRVIVAVSKLDLIPASERATVFQHICQKIANISSKIPVCPISPLEESSDTSSGFAEIVSQIESLVSQSERRIWRSRQVSGQLSDWLARLQQIAREVISSIEMSAAEKKRYLLQTQSEIAKAEIDWEKLRIDLDKRRLQRAKEIRQQVTANQSEMLENLEFELQKTPDIKVWWERDLPFRLRRELTVISRKSENFMFKLLSQDIEWLHERVKQFGSNFKQEGFAPKSNLEINFAIEDKDITNIQRYRTMTRIGSTVAMMGGSILGGPIGMAASTGILLFSEQYLGKKLDIQKQVLTNDLKQIIEISLDRYCQEVSTRLRQFYFQIADNVEKEESSWKQVKISTFQAMGNEQPSPHSWQEITQQSLLLQQEIANSLSI